MMYRAFTGFLLFIHFVLTRGFAMLILGSWVWYMSSTFNMVSGGLESLVEAFLVAVGANQFFTLLIMQSKPEQVILFMTILIPLYILFSFVLYPLRKSWLQRTTKMLVIHIVALIMLYLLAWFAGDFFKEIMNTSLLLRDHIFDLMGYSDTAERIKAFVRLIEPRTILAVILITIFLYLLYELPSIVRFLMGGGETLTGNEEKPSLPKEKK